MGGPDPLVLSEDREIFHHEEFHAHEHLPGRSKIYFPIRSGLEGQDGSLCDDTNVRLVGHLAESPIRHLVRGTDD